MEFLYTPQKRKIKHILTGVATDSHRLSSSSMPIENVKKFNSFILPRKLYFHLCSLLERQMKK